MPPMRTIMIVEDELLVAMSIKTAMEGSGYKVIHMITSGEEAIRRTEEIPPDIILMDIRLEGEIDGIEAASRIRSRYDIPVIFLTAYADKDILERAKMTEPYGYLIKPFEIRELHAAIEVALYKHRKRELEKSIVLNTISEHVVYHDPGLRVVWTNKAAADFTGQAPDQLWGKLCYEAFFARSQPCEGCPVVKALETGLPQKAEMATEDGKVWFMRGYPVVDPNGELTGVIQVKLDITRHKQAEERLLATKYRLQHLLISSPAVIYAFEPMGSHTITFVSENVRNRFGFESRQFLDDRDFWASRVHPEDLERVLRMRDHVFHEGHLVLEYRFRLENGDTRWIYDESKLVCGPEGNVLEVVGCWIDITEIKRAEGRIRRLTQQIMRAQEG